MYGNNISTWKLLTDFQFILHICVQKRFSLKKLIACSGWKRYSTAHVLFRHLELYPAGPADTYFNMWIHGFLDTLPYVTTTWVHKLLDTNLSVLESNTFRLSLGFIFSVNYQCFAEVFEGCARALYVFL